MEFFVFAETMSNPKFLSVIIFVSLFGVVLAADIAVVAGESDHIYGKGVHAFFDQNYEEAITILSQAEEMKSNDPRVYYFLGLAYLRQKKTEQADQCFEKAAQMEYSGRSIRDYEISESLRRIQGIERLRIEKIRTAERINAQKREQQIREARYGTENAAGREALRQSSPQNPKETLSVILQNMADELGDNAFGVKPLNPVAVSEGNVAVMKQEVNPFGEVRETVREELKVPVQVIERAHPPAVARPGRQFVNPNVPVARTPEKDKDSTASDMNFNRRVQTGIAKEIGKGLGTLFSKKRTSNE